MIIKVGESFHLDKEWNIEKSKDNGWFYYNDFVSGSFTVNSINYSYKTNSIIGNKNTSSFDTSTNDVFYLTVTLCKSGSNYHTERENENDITITTTSYKSGVVMNWETFPSSSIYPWNIISGSQP